MFTFCTVMTLLPQMRSDSGTVGAPLLPNLKPSGVTRFLTSRALTHSPAAATSAELLMTILIRIRVPGLAVNLPFNLPGSFSE